MQSFVEYLGICAITQICWPIKYTCTSMPAMLYFNIKAKRTDFTTCFIN